MEALLLNQMFEHARSPGTIPILDIYTENHTGRSCVFKRLFECSIGASVNILWYVTYVE